MNNIIKSAFQIGMTASETIVEIIRINPEISYTNFYIYKPHYNVNELRKKLLLPKLLFHDPSRETVRLKREKIMMGNLKSIVDSLEKDTVIGVLSKFSRKNEIYHIPLMDFSCAASGTNLKMVEWFLKEIGQQGIILSSGRSYHYYGVNPMGKKEWSNFLGDCLLSGLVDTRYVGHGLKDGCSILRLSACQLRAQVPIIVSILK